MARHPKPLCKIKKAEIEPFMPELLTYILPAKFICIKCLRVASGKKWLCKPKKLS